MGAPSWDDQRHMWEQKAAVVRAESPIADVIGEHVQLQPAGGRNLKGPCPFCESTPAKMNVAPSRGFFYCFDCQAGGDMFAFVRDFHRVTLREAVEHLAVRAGGVLS